MENLYKENCITTFTGKQVNVFDPDPETICIEDIAHALSHQCRFGGHLPKFYSVAQHSTSCADLVQDEFKLQALMHDASEAYLLDIPTPVKKGLSNYREMEDTLMNAIAKKFGFEYPLSPRVKRADKHMLEFEWHTLMHKPNTYVQARCWPSTYAKKHFLEYFNLINS